MKYTRSLPDGGSVILSHSGGVFRAIAFKPGAKETVSYDGLTHLSIPFLFSGVVLNPISQDDSGVGIRFTDETRRRMTNYQSLGPVYLDMQRFRCKYGPDFEMFIPEILRGRAGRTEHSQYHQQFATWYSGTMAQVVQIAGAYGRQDFNNLPPGDPYEQLLYDIPEDLKATIWPEIEYHCLPGYSGRAPITGQYQFNFQFDDTDLVAFDEKREPWLVKVNSMGIWAMPCRWSLQPQLLHSVNILKPLGIARLQRFWTGLAVCQAVRAFHWVPRFTGGNVPGQSSV